MLASKANFSIIAWGTICTTSKSSSSHRSRAKKWPNSGYSQYNEVSNFSHLSRFISASVDFCMVDSGSCPPKISTPQTPMGEVGVIFLLKSTFSTSKCLFSVVLFNGYGVHGVRGVVRVFLKAFSYSVLPWNKYTQKC